MRTKLAALALFLLIIVPGASLAQGDWFNQCNQPIPVVKVSQLLACNTDLHCPVAIVKDGASGTDVTTGGGSTYVFAVCGASGWLGMSTSAGGSGTVTSVAAAGPTGIATWSAAVTTSGTLTQTLATQTANKVLASAVSGGAATPAFRALVSADIPNNGADTTGNAATATALAANGANCTSTGVAQGVDASGAAEGCTQDWPLATNTVTGGGTASKCARFDASHHLIEATGDCSAGASAGIDGSTGSTDNAILRADGTGGSTAQSSSTAIDDSGNLTLNGGAGRIDLGTVEFAGGGGPQITRASNAMEFGVNSGPIFGGNGSSGDTGAFLSSTGMVTWSSGNPSSSEGDTSIKRAAATVVKFTDAVMTTPIASPPVTCNSGNEGVIYTDTSHALCYCDGAAWQVLNPLTSGVGTCS